MDSVVLVSVRSPADFSRTGQPVEQGTTLPAPTAETGGFGSPLKAGSIRTFCRFEAPAASVNPRQKIHYATKTIAGGWMQFLIVLGLRVSDKNLPVDAVAAQAEIAADPLMPFGQHHSVCRRSIQGEPVVCRSVGVAVYQQPGVLLA